MSHLRHAQKSDKWSGEEWSEGRGVLHNIFTVELLLDNDLSVCELHSASKTMNPLGPKRRHKLRNSRFYGYNSLPGSPK
jgi:hypothetical protein